MFKKSEEFLNILKTNKKLFWTFSLFIVLVIISLLLKFDTTKSSNNISIKTDNKDDNNSSYDNYIYSLENKLENIIGEIDGITSVKTMIYTKNSPKLEPIYNENTNTESNIETGTDGIKRETRRDTTQKQVETKDNEVVLEKYYEYPEISGVLIVVDYTGSQNIYKILINSVKVLLDVDLNNIEIIVSNKRGVN